MNGEARNWIDVVQISDCHLYGDREAGLYGLNSHRALSEVVARAARRQPDLALLTGDLVHDESEAGYRLLAESLAPLDAPRLCIPGNHDDLALMRRVLAGNGGCDGEFLLGGWLFVMLDSQVAGEVGGRLAPDQLDRLDRALARHKGHHAVVALHHQPVAVGSRWLDAIGLGNAEELFTVLDRHTNVRALLWGHVHQVFEGERRGVRLLSAPATCIQFRPASDEFALDTEATPGYRWLRLHHDGTVESGIERLAEMPGRVDASASGYDEDNG